jgi:Ca2+-binding EF-hand superfamily protein
VRTWRTPSLLSPCIHAFFSFFQPWLQVDASSNIEAGRTSFQKVNHLQLQRMSRDERASHYRNASRIVGEGPIDAMEQMLRDKLNQRTASGPAQLRRNFKYFDRDASGDIDLDEFMFALDLMGLTFNYNQTVALFARYDRSISGTFDYQDFCDVLMEFDFGSIAKTSTGSNLKKMMANIFDFENTTSQSSIDSRSSTNSSQNSSDEEDFESSTDLSCVDVHHVRRVFDMLDRDGNGHLDMYEIQDLLEALGVTNLSHEQLRRGMSRLDLDGNNKVDFDEFFEWYSKHATP